MGFDADLDQELPFATLKSDGKLDLEGSWNLNYKYNFSIPCITNSCSSSKLAPIFDHADRGCYDQRPIKEVSTTHTYSTCLFYANHASEIDDSWQQPIFVLPWPYSADKPLNHMS